MKVFFTSLMLFCVSTVTALAEDLVCPELATAVQVNSCPSESELKYTFTGYCSDNRRMYDQGKDLDVCESFENYRRLKNSALWEAGDGAFDAYLSCDLSPAVIKAGKVKGISIMQKEKLTKVVCAYEGDITFIHRTKARCTVDEGIDCRKSSAACKAHCQ